MPAMDYEIRTCIACGLRYPLPITHETHTTRCPVCMGDTQIVLRRDLIIESKAHPRDIRHHKRETSMLLDNIRSAWNVGAIFRSADGFGYSHAYLCGITPTPGNDSVRKTSLGAEKSIPWTYHKDAVKLAKGLKELGHIIIALEDHERAVPISETTQHDSATRMVVIVGNEITGVDPGLLDLCDEIYFIPMHGTKKSFNVAIAFGIAAYTLWE